MASPKVQPVNIVLNVKGADKFKALNSAFRDLSKQAKLSDADIVKATKDIADFAEKAGNSEATIKGQIKALEGLRQQALQGGKAYTALTVDIKNLEDSLRGSSVALEDQRRSLVKIGSSSKVSAESLMVVINQLEQLKSQVRKDSAAYVQLTKDIKTFNNTLKETQVSAGRAGFTVSEFLTAKPEKITGQIKRLEEVIRSTKTKAEDLATALQKLELLRVGAGRSQTSFRAEVFSSTLGVEYFERLRKEYGNLEKTQAAISQRISEVNLELANVTGYERRRALTLELISLNKELRNSVESVMTAEKFQRLAVRQRASRNRAQLSGSGFLSFSQQADEYPARAKAKQKARNRLINEQELETTDKIFSTWVEAYEKIQDAARNHKIEMARIQKSQGDLLIEIQDKQAAEELAREKNQNDKLLDIFDQRLKQRDRVLQRSTAIKGSLGLSGRELSPFYQGIVGIGTSRASAEQARMGRTPQRALTDIIDVFNSDLDRTGDGFLDSERKLREAAIEFSGGSKKVRQAFESIALGKTPEGMFPRVGESSREYQQRLEISSYNLFDYIKNFGRKIKSTGDGFLDSEQKLREAAINFAGGSLEVRKAFEKIPLGKTPISMFPGSAESKESYMQRLRGGFSEFNLPNFVNFRKGTTRELQLVRQQLEEFRLDLDPLSASFERLEKRAVSSLKRIDRELARRSKGGRRGLSAGQFGQAAGATLSGGIFGGPEGFLGGAIGTALGGPGGAFAGAAVGAQLGQIRRQVGQFAEYSAEIAKLQIALRGAAGSQEEFNRAVEAARSATTELNVPQEAAIRGMTRLTAAVKGAGGQVSDAELVFRNVSSAIKATGGNAQDVASALTAMVQVFSKGKVSAEELSGQLGERLPGAVTKFAKANKLTLPELQKALKAGTVGLNELMRFIEALGEEYDGTSRKIASSSEEAGARLQIAYNEMRISIGSALEPIGAEFQNAFAQFIYEYTPELTAAAQAIGNAMLALSRVLKPILAGLASFAAVFAAGKLAALIKGVAASLGLFGATTKVAAGSVAALTAAMLTNPLFLGAAAVGGIVAGIVLITDALGKQRRELEALNNEMARRAPSLSANERNIAITANRRELDLVNREIKEFEKIREGDESGTVSSSIVQLKNRRLELLKAQRALTKSTVLRTSDTDFGSPKPESSGAGAGTRSKDISDLQLEAQLAKIIAGRREASYELRRKALRLSREAAVKASEELKPNQQILAILRASEEYRKGILQIQKEIAREEQKAFDAANKRAKERFKKEYGFAPDFDGKIFGELGDQKFDPEADSLIPTELETRIRDIKLELEELANPINAIVGGAAAIGEAFSQSFVDVISGSKSANEALSSFFADVGKYFLELATKIIAKMITMAILNSIVGLFPGGGSSAFGGLSNGSFFGGGGSALDYSGNFGAGFGFAEGGYAPGGFKAFRSGGMVSQPTVGLVGEGSESEYIIPESKMRESMNRYSRGVRGPGVIPENGGATTMEGEGNIAVAAPIDVRYTVERINQVDYVTADEFRRGMKQAAQQGASEGQQRTLYALRQNTTQRRRIGI